MKVGVYQIRNLKNSKRYIGSAADSFRKRWNKHGSQLRLNNHHSQKLQNAWNKHGADAFVFEVLLYCDPENCLMYEQIALDYYKPEYNIALIASAPMTGLKHSEQTKQKLRGNKHAVGYRHSKETKSTMSATRKGKKPTEEHKQKLSIAQSGERGNGAKLKSSDIPLVFHHYYKDGLTQAAIANIFNVSRRTIGMILNKQTWKHINNPTNNLIRTYMERFDQGDQ